MSESTLERSRSEALANPAQPREWTLTAKFQAVLATAAMDEASKSAWYRNNGVYSHELAVWREHTIDGLAQPRQKRLTAAEAKQERRRLKQPAREIKRKDRALEELLHCWCC